MRFLILIILMSLAAGAQEVLLVNDPGEPDKPVHWEFTDEPLGDVVETLGRELGLPILVPSQFEKEIVNASFDGIPVKEALRSVLEPQGLTISAPGNFSGYANARVVKGRWAWPQMSKVTDSFSVEASVPGLTYELSFTSDGVRAAWKLLPLSHHYLWCGNSWDYYESGELPQTSFEILEQEIRRNTWATSSQRGRPINPKTAYYTLVGKNAWNRLSVEQVANSPQLKSLIDLIYEPIAPELQERVCGEHGGIRDAMKSADTGLEPVRNDEVFRAYFHPPNLDARVDCDFSGTRLDEAIQELASRAEFQWFLSPTDAIKLTSYRARGVTLQEALDGIAGQLNLEWRLKDDLILIGNTTALDQFPDLLRLWRSMSMAPDTKWKALPSSLNLTERHSRYYKANHSLALVQSPVNGTWGALYNPRNASILNELLDPDNQEEFTWSEEMLDQVTREYLGLSYLPRIRAIELAREITPGLILSQGKHGYTFECRGKRRDYHRLRDAIRDIDKIENLEEVELRGNALYHSSSDVGTRLPSRDEKRKYFLIQEYPSQDFILVKGFPRQLNQRRTLLGKVTRLHAPTLSDWVERKYGRPLIQDTRGVVLVEERT